MNGTVQKDNTATQQFAAAYTRSAKSTGLLMIVVGIFCILLPNVIAVTFNAFVGVFFLLAAAIFAYRAWHHNKQQLSLWFMPFILLVFGIVILMHPAIVLSVLGLFIALYFLLSGFSSIMLSFELSSTAKYVYLSNGLLSFLLGVLVFSSWPFGSAWIVGLIIGINFILDGIALLSVAKFMKNST
jgi:uncharacterized membrane protein HdeD (DUF308 family)